MTTYILDSGGEPLGSYRDNQDPSVPQRLHPVPARNVNGDEIIDGSTGEPVMHMLPLDDPRTITELTAEGLCLDGTAIVEIDAGETGTKVEAEVEAG